MPDVLIRNLDARTVEWLKSQAASHGRSLQAELKAIIEKEQESEMRARQAFLDRLDALVNTMSPIDGDSADLIREDCDSDHGHDW